MHYLFSGFTLDTEKKALYYQSKLVSLTKQNYLLLSYFVENTGVVITKDQLIEDVWQGRIVADNSIDQSIYKLKKVLSAKSDEDYFENIYGLGTKFLPPVKSISHQDERDKTNIKTSLFKPIIGLTVLGLVVFLLLDYQNNPNILIKSNHENPIFVVLPNPDITAENNWLQNSPNVYIEKLLKLSNTVSLKNYQDKPNNLNQQQYLDTQWKLSPQLRVVTSDVSLKGNTFTVKLSISNKLGETQQQTFKSGKLNTAFFQAMQWLGDQISVDKLMTPYASLIPSKPYLLELYMRGLSAVSNKKTDEAINYFELCLDENPDYHLAALELSKLMNKKGESTKALALLNSIAMINQDASIEIDAINIQGEILLRQGKPGKAKELYLKLLKKYSIGNYANLLVTQHQLGIVYRTLSQNDLALKQLSDVELILNESQNYEFLANVYQAKGSLLLRIGETEQAITYVAKAMQLFVKLGDLIGQAKTHSVTARISIQQANYTKATVHLKQALNITKSLNHKFGIGATLNEIISVLIAQGKIDEAWALNQELEAIAIEIDFLAMLLAAKRYTVIISDLKQQWQTADIYLKEHLEIALAANNKRAIIENRFLTISLGLKQNKTDNTKQLIKELDVFIKDNNEQRLKPQLNILKAKYYYQIDEIVKAETLLISSKVLATATDDRESIININNLLAKYYLESNQATKALLVLNESTDFLPISQPYLMLKSKANKQLNHLTKAIELANRCKLESHDLWSKEDSLYLTELVNLKNPKNRQP